MTDTLTPPEDFSPYDVLGVDPEIPQEDLAKVYRTIAKTCHPDLFPGDKAAREKFRQLNNAYALVNTRLKRMQYDRENLINQTQASTKQPNTSQRPQPQSRSQRQPERRPYAGKDRQNQHQTAGAGGNSTRDSTKPLTPQQQRMQRARSRTTARASTDNVRAQSAARPARDIRKEPQKSSPIDIKKKSPSPQAPPAVSFNFDLKKNSKSMSRGVLTIPILLVGLLLIGLLIDLFGGPSEQERRNIAIIDKVKLIGELRDSTVKELKEIDGQGHTLFYVFSPRSLQPRNDFFILTKEQAKALAAQKKVHDKEIEETLAKAKEDKEASGETLSADEETAISDKPFPFSVFSIPQVDFNMPEFLLDAVLLDPVTANVLDSISNCLAENSYATELDCPHTKPRLTVETVDK